MGDSVRNILISLLTIVGISLGLNGCSSASDGALTEELSAGVSHTCFVDGMGLVDCWGSNDYGQIDVPDNLGKVTQISAGGDHTCALNDEGLLDCWGYNDYGQTDVPDNLGKITQISAGVNHTCVLNDRGLVDCWGRNDDGETDVPIGLATTN